MPPDNAIPVITIDGPGGSGKGTVASLLARRLGWHLLDSGVLYRLVGLQAERTGCSSPEDLGRLAAELPVEFQPVKGAEPRVLLDGEDVSEAIRSAEAGNQASRVAAIPSVRAGLGERQRSFRQPPGLVADGRDMGTVIFPDAPLKIFLDASVSERAERRYKQLKEKGESVNLSRLFRDIKERDERDRNRPVAPLLPADDAILVDSTGMTIEEVLARILSLAAEKHLIPE